MIRKRVPEFVEGLTFIIENVYVDYASVFKPNTKYRPEWAVVIRVPPHLVNEYADVGFKLKQDQDGSYTLRAKRYTTLSDGTHMEPPEVVDADGIPWTESRGLIGNGSRCNVKVRAKYQMYNGVEGLSCYLEGLQVLDLVPYSGGVGFKPAEGNTAGWGNKNFTPQQPQQPQQPQYPQQSQQSQQPQQPQVPSHQGGFAPGQQGYQQHPQGHQQPAQGGFAPQPPPQQPPQQNAPDPYSQVPREAQAHPGFNPAQVAQGVLPQGPPQGGHPSAPQASALSYSPSVGNDDDVPF